MLFTGKFLRAIPLTFMNFAENHLPVKTYKLSKTFLTKNTQNG
jgi:hypothetical protein